MNENGNGEQLQFRLINADVFFRTQIIHERKDRPRQNERYTNAFHTAFDALVASEYDKTPALCKLLKRKCFQWLLYKEFVFFCELHGKTLPDEVTLASAFGYSERRFRAFRLAVQKKLPANKFAARSYAEFMSFNDAELRYAQLPIKHIAVCATMSAGKSTFVNALLGRDVLPARNEATTAKITSVYDKDGAEKMIGFVQKRDGTCDDKCSDIQLFKLNEWNDSSCVERIFLQGDLDGIRNKGMIVAVHDTPGTNNSGDKSHHDMTMRFLKENTMDALVFVANATQLCTMDEKILLSELLKNIVKPFGIPVMFIMNRADELDEDKENVTDILSRYNSYLSDIGFTSPAIFPVSSQAARLLKMASSGRSLGLTPKEQRKLSSIQEQYKNIDSTGITSVERYIENMF
ncbi:MAG: dynamin family protein [Treponema sp.]|nr:dynamin family protein [Treponema sp.]